MYNRYLTCRNLEDHIVQQLSYIFIFVNMLHTAIKLQFLSSSVVTTFTLVVITLHRMQNVIVTGLIFAQLFLINKLFQYQATLKTDLKKKGRSQNLINQVVLVWFAHAAFFYQVIHSVNN